MSLSGTTEHPVSKTKTDKKLKEKKSPSYSKPKASESVINLSHTQAFRSQPADETEVPTDATKQSLEASMSAEEQEQEYQVTEVETISDDEELETLDSNPWVMFLWNLRAKQLMTSFMIPTDIYKDSDLASIPDDDIWSIFGSQTSETEDKRETNSDDETNLNASGEESLQPIRLLASTLKDLLPSLIHDSVKSTVQESIEEQTFIIQATKELSKVIQTKIGKKVKAKVQTGLSSRSFKKANVEGEKNNPKSPEADTDNVEGEQLFVKTTKDAMAEQVSTKENVSCLQDPPRDQRKGKRIPDEDAQMKQLIPLIKQIFQRENEFHLDSTTQLIKQLKHIKKDTPKGREMVKKLQFAIEARDDVNEARRIIRENLDDGLIPAECKASAGNEDPLKCKASAGNEDALKYKASVGNEDPLKCKASEGNEDPLKCKASASNKDPLSAKHQRVMKTR
nr:hypothetical protein [Tanacetum cinerariifolium]